jgi:hypothetical protein
MSAAMDAFDEYHDQHGKQPGYEERKKIIDRLFIEKPDSKWNPFDKPTPYYQVKPSERASFVDSVIPKDWRAKGEASLRKQGVEPTPELLLDLYNKDRNQ